MKLDKMLKLVKNNGFVSFKIKPNIKDCMKLVEMAKLAKEKDGWLLRIPNGRNNLLCSVTYDPFYDEEPKFGTKANKNHPKENWQLTFQLSPNMIETYNQLAKEFPQGQFCYIAG